MRDMYTVGCQAYLSRGAVLFLQRHSNPSYSWVDIANTCSEVIGHGNFSGTVKLARLVALVRRQYDNHT